jgi:hypothetical protein
MGGEMVKFLRRKSDGKFYRGARFWIWCRSWRNASALHESFWNTFIIDKIKYDFELVTLDEILEAECEK